MKHWRQRKYEIGMISLTLITVVAMAIAAIGWLIYFQQTRLEQAQADLATSQAEVKHANESIDTMGKANLSLQDTIGSLKKMNTIEAEERQKHQADQAVIVKKVETIIRVLPKPTPKAVEAVVTPEDTTVLAQRSAALWEAYCLADPSNSQCTQGA